MTKLEFEQLFRKGLDTAARNAEEYFDISVPRDFRVVLYGADRSGAELPIEECVELLYLGEDRFFKLIDLAVLKVSGGTTAVFVRVSEHQPGSFQSTAHYSDGMGPFHQLISGEIELDNGVKLATRKL